MEISCHVYFPFLLLKARQCGDSSAEEKGQRCFLTTGNNARISANILCVEGQHLFHIWTESSPSLSVTAPPMAKKRLFNHMQAARQDGNAKQDSVCL